MESVVKQYLKALVDLKEDDFTRDIIKPLFESMGYEKVDFNGGSYERGRDLIAQRRIPPKKENYVVYIQSKKVGDIQNTSMASKLSTLLHQLRQCCLGTLTDDEGNEISPNEVAKLTMPLQVDLWKR
ncbi:restriction endonuclease [Colwellia demingiae]|uniref:Restriction endonuclease n=1 Tax=Colwellia demingiae TaxID=89401 RepID=A0A5C6QDY6_9GAMM|nr:restriction endonuclease [Colwellia demingiae]TWX66877.1 restriction endonuclease [Colwellia demingiae]